MADVTTQGWGSVEREPDRAGLQVTYTGTGRDRALATVALTKLVEPVERVLERPGVEVRVRRLNVHGNHGEKGRREAAASQYYQLRVTDLALLDDLVAELLTAGPAHLDGPAWQLAGQAAADREAQRAAVRDARATAEGLADALGLALGELVAVSDGADGGGGRFAPGGLARTMSHVTSVDVGALNLVPEPVTVSAACRATWNLVAGSAATAG